MAGRAKSNPVRLGNTILGKCVDCKEPCLIRDEYIVRPEVWEQAGMKGWTAGFLHQGCLAKRLGRDLTAEDYLANADGESRPKVRVDYDWPALKNLLVENGAL
jgi:hypothetical protein